MGFISAAFGILVSKHEPTLGLLLQLIAKTVTCGGSVVKPEDYDTLEDKQFQIELFDDLEPEDPDCFASDVDMTDEDAAHDFRWMSYVLKTDKAIKVGPGCCWYMIGPDSVDGMGKCVRVTPDSLSSLEDLRQRWVMEGRLSSTADYVTITNCCG